MGSHHGPRQLYIDRKGVKERPLLDFYHRMMRISWAQFFLYLLVIFFLFNCLFATLYDLTANDGIANISDRNFWNYFFFSVQTSASIGYGYFHPMTTFANAVVSVEAFGGLLMNALITGLVFARFSRPSARILFSQNILFVNYYDKPALMLRLGNARINRIYEGRARWVFLRDVVTPEGDKFRKMMDLKLIRDTTTVFALSWTLIHIIDEESPLFGIPFEKLKDSEHEFMITFSGLDEETAQTLASHAVYWTKDLVRAKKYKDMIDIGENGLRKIDFAVIDAFEEA